MAARLTPVDRRPAVLLELWKGEAQVRRYFLAAFLAAAFGGPLWNAGVNAAPPTPLAKPEWVSQPLAVHLGLVEPDLHGTYSDFLDSGDSGAGMLPPQARSLARQAFAAADRGHWTKARRLAGKINHPLVSRTLQWLWLTSPGANTDFKHVSAFIRKHPDWPYQSILERHAEDLLVASIDEATVLAWFKDREPRTGWGRVRLAEAKMASGERAEGLALLRRAWAENNFTRAHARAVYRHHKKDLRTEDHVARLDRLIWDRRRSAARGMLSLVDRGHRRLAEARMALMRRSGNVDALIARIPANLKSSAGLAYERTRWRRQKGLDERAREYLLNPLKNMERPDKWWNERSILARQALVDGHVTEAYRMIKDHGLKEGADFAEAEWLAGWVALTFLRDAEVALNHFKVLFDGVNYPVSKARAAYWSGRAADALGRPKLSKKWYGLAAKHPTTYYGQLAVLRLHGANTNLNLPPDPQPTAKDVDRFKDLELVHVARILAEAGADRLLRPFFLRLNDMAQSPGEHALVAGLAISLGRPDLAITSAKRSAQAGVILTSLSYPEVPLLTKTSEDESPLIHAVSRQESQFDPRAVSAAGARGLMQLMPRTARLVARKMKVRYARSRLISDPDYNARLGTRYLTGLVDKYQGSYPLALAAYNAGETRVNRWIRQWGDPRKGEIDTVDWIELIPYAETRNYVQRVMEGLQVYRQRLTVRNVALELNQDLNRQSASPATAASGCSC
jgi:soluble lytic murein transglycosylase